MERSISAHAHISLVKIIIAQPKQMFSQLHSWRQRVGDPNRNEVSGHRRVNINPVKPRLTGRGPTETWVIRNASEIIANPKSTYGLIHHPGLNHDQRLKGNLHEQANAGRNDRLVVYPNCRVGEKLSFARRLRAILKIANNREIEIPCQNSNRLGYTFGDAFWLAFALSWQNHRLTADYGLIMNVFYRIHLQWIPSHVDIHGNDIADALAKAGADDASVPSAPLTYLELFFRSKSRNKTIWLIPPEHHWYQGSRPGGCLSGLFWYPRFGWETSLFPHVNNGKSDVSQPNRGYQNGPLSIDCSRHNQTTLTRFLSGHIRSLTFSDNSKCFEICPKCAAEQATPDHILACMGLSTQDLVPKSHMTRAKICQPNPQLNRTFNSKLEN
ncbi:hypothetical protein AVEN_133930-1 [Araneus ventricosus]|uniref:RNase H type-1 domain-containing protein n=1 Tax=Araneus ventricosus TaxID=182803 RepID=A0A4Y2D3C7_ARAVE|nr:hypothetical protein AVEN_133930-1 [Araneus ventricosus]